MGKFIMLDLWRNERSCGMTNIGLRWINTDQIAEMGRYEKEGWTRLDIACYKDEYVWCTAHPNEIIERIEGHDNAES